MREICQACGEREAHFRYKEISRGASSAIALCRRCAIERGVIANGADSEPIDTRQIWQRVLKDFSALQTGRSGTGLACPSCGLVFAEFEAGGRLGCPQCYQTFMGDMTRLLKDYHGDNQHRGKAPYDIGRRIDLRRRILSVKEDIQMAVGDERFEDAARLRDELRDLDGELGRLLREDSAR